MRKIASAPRRRRGPKVLTPDLKAEIITRLRLWAANRPKVLAREFGISTNHVHILKYNDVRGRQ